MLICILTKNVITSCSVTMMLFLHLEVKPLMTLTTVLYLSCALISGHLAMMLTLALGRFPPNATKEIQCLNAKGALTYTDIAGDPVLYGNLPPREISMKDVFRSGDSSKKFKI